MAWNMDLANRALAPSTSERQGSGFGPRAWIAIAIIVIASFAYNRWLLDARTFFYVDDWQWLWRAEFFPWSAPEFSSLFPSSVYNDRPVGAAIIKAGYTAFGLDHRAFQLVWLALHTVNCVLAYAIARRFTSHAGALLAGVLSALWFSANGAVGWTTAIFDLFAATLCLAIVLLRQMSRQRGDRIALDLAGAACYLVAIRTKEFAIGMIAVLFVLNVLVERQSIRATIRQLLPYLAVFLVYAARYAQLVGTSTWSSGDPYKPQLSVSSIATNLALYVSKLFYAETRVESIAVVVVVLMFGVGLAVANGSARRAALWGIASFIILLSPLLLLPARVDPLYLYAPHFFVALAIGALVTDRLRATAAAALVVAAILIPPIWPHPRSHIIDFYYDLGERNRALFHSAVKILERAPPGSTVFISGLEPFFNPFSTQPGNAVNVGLRQFDVKVDIEGTEGDLARRFCEAKGARYFLRADGKRLSDVTGDAESACERSR